MSECVPQFVQLGTLQRGGDQKDVDVGVSTPIATCSRTEHPGAKHLLRRLQRGPKSFYQLESRTDHREHRAAENVGSIDLDHPCGAATRFKNQPRLAEIVDKTGGVPMVDVGQLRRPADRKRLRGRSESAEQSSPRSWYDVLKRRTQVHSNRVATSGH